MDPPESNPISENCPFLADFMRTAGFMRISTKVRIIGGYLTSKKETETRGYFKSPTNRQWVVEIEIYFGSQRILVSVGSKNRTPTPKLGLV
jgi:hypothetical protein